jgi:hypothetical protein
MISKKDIEKDLDNMTMAQIKVYVEELKGTIYHMAETMEMMSSSYKMVEKDLKEFSGVAKKSNSSKKSFTKTSIITKPVVKEKEETIEESEFIEKDVEENEEDDIEVDEEEVTEDGPYVAVFTYTVFGDADKVIIAPDGHYYSVKSVEPDQFTEIETHTEYLPYYYFDHTPSTVELKNAWKVFCNEFDTSENGDGFELKTVEIVDQNKQRTTLI